MSRKTKEPEENKIMIRRVNCGYFCKSADGPAGI